MRCYNCKKNFDYEKYYGICPKCGCYNKRETQEEQHQKYHDEYDKGYTHGEVLNPVEETEKSAFRKVFGGANGFLLISFLIALLVFVGGTVASLGYEKVQESRVQKRAMEQEAVRMGHEMGEEFSLGSIRLRVEEAKVLATDEELDFPKGKQLVALRLSCRGGGEWEDGNILSEMFIFCGDSFYRQIDDFTYEPYGNVYQCPALDSYALCREEEAEGWVAFLTEKGIEGFTLYVEERSGKNQAYLDAVHTVDILLEEEE